MNTVKPVTLGVIGTGMISRQYLDTVSHKFSILRLKAIADRKREKAEKMAAEYGVVGCTIDELMNDPEIEMILNLTPPPVHYSIMKEALLRGKHAYTEKSFTLTTKEAEDLMRIANEKKLYVGSAPDTFFSSWVQNARHLIDQGAIGKITSFAMIGNRDNNRLLSAMRYLNQPGGGIILDYSVYYLTVLVNLLGPVAEVSARIKAPYKTHVNIFKPSPDYGKVFETPNESEVFSILELENGITGTLCINADSAFFDQTYFAIYGDKGILYLGCPDWFNGSVFAYWNNEDYKNAANPVRELQPDPYAFKTDTRGVGVADAAWAIRTGRNPRVNAATCFHVLDVQEKMVESAENNGQFIRVISTCQRSQPLPIPEAGREESSLYL